MLLSAGVDGFHLFFFYGVLLGKPLQIELDELIDIGVVVHNQNAGLFHGNDFLSVFIIP